MTDHHENHTETEQTPERSGQEERNPTAPQAVNNPGERTTPPSNPDRDPERVRNNEEDLDRTAPG